MSGKRQHFVPRHYLRHFALAGTETVAIAIIEPFKFVGSGGIKDQCKGDNFYEEQGADDVMSKCEADLAPALARVIKNEAFDPKELVALQFLAATLHVRTRKAAEVAKVWPKHIAHQVIDHGIKRGRLPAPKGGWTEDMMDFGGIPGFLIKNLILPAWMEMQTLKCKLLKAPPEASFVTSDNPVAMLNELFIHLEPNRSYVGFSRSGFELLLPISPRLCLFFYDGKAYKVGGRRHALVEISKEDVEIVNSLQVQSADKSLYFHDPAYAPVVAHLVRHYSHLRTPVDESLQTFPTPDGKQTFLHHRRLSVKLARPWSFCRRVRHVNIGFNERRDPAWTELVTRLSNDMHDNPNDTGIFTRIERMLGIKFEGNDGKY